MIIVETGDPRNPQAIALLEQSHALMQSLFPAEANHYLSIDALCEPNIRFFIAREGTELLGTGAVALKDGYGEVKSMFTGEAARGKGVAAAILRAIEDCARDEGLAMLKLETGSLLHDAHRLYERQGFSRCGPFGAYEEAEFSLFYEKPLA